ncbi:MAG: KilA-N domain-containing protein [Lewinellaceae bacterium]|nr:KilA-N domain-containing protein [Lewinellaceae bacterium]
MAKKKLVVQGVEISLFQREEAEYICISDIAQKFGEARIVIANWMRNRTTLRFLGKWEELYNPEFNRIEFDTLLFESGENTFTMTPTKWIKTTGAIGIEVKMGRGGGTFAHKDLALGFCYWASPEFQLYVIKEFQRLKEDEAQRLSTDWNVKRLMSKANFHIHREAVRENLVPHIDWNTKREAIFQASETDLINLALFGMTAKEWRIANPNKKGNMRDHASTAQLLVLSNLQSLNAKLLKWDCDKGQRFQILHESAKEELSILVSQRAIKDIKKLK